MSFDYFNTSYLAFGQKLYSAFATLDSLAKEAKLNIDKIMTYQSLFDDYLNKNYSVPIPQNPESPCRSSLRPPNVVSSLFVLHSSLNS